MQTKTAFRKYERKAVTSTEQLVDLINASAKLLTTPEYVAAERDIERELVKRVKKAGGEVRKVKWIGRRGAPDRLVLLPPKKHPVSGVTLLQGRTIWVELKAPGKKPRRNQERELRALADAGQTVYVIDSIESVHMGFPI